MKKKIIVLILLVVILAAVILFVKMNYKEKTVNSEGEIIFENESGISVDSNDKDEDEAESIEDVLAKNDFKSNNELQIQSLKSYNDGDSLLLEGSMVLSFDKAYIFFGGSKKKDMKALTGVKDKYLKNLKDDESLFIVIKNGEPKCVITDEDGILFSKSDADSKDYIEFSPSTVTILDLKVEDGVYNFVY